MTLDILVVEDDASWKGLHKMVLGELGANPVITDNLEAALKEAREKKFDLYITDGTYPAKPDTCAQQDMCYEFYKKIKEINPEAKIVVVTSGRYSLPNTDYPDMPVISKGAFYQKIGELLKSVEADKNGKS